MKIAENEICKSYKVVQSLIDKNEIREFVYESFKTHIESTRKFPLMSKCFEFALLKQQMLKYLNDERLESDSGNDLNSLMDYIDNTFSFLFFKGLDNKPPLHQFVDDEYYFALLSFAIDRIEFPSLVNEELRESFEWGKRKRLPLAYRNYRATYLPVVKAYLAKIYETYANEHGKFLTWDELRTALKKNQSRIQSVISDRYTMNLKYLTRNTKSNVVKVFRGYDIASTQDVIVGRKKRTQDANQSCSFTLNKTVARGFAEYKLKKFFDGETCSYKDRFTLVNEWFDKQQREDYAAALGRKFVLSEYELPLDCIIISTLSTTVAELEVIALPSDAKVTRYSFVCAS